MPRKPAKIGRPKSTAAERKLWRYPRLSVPLTPDELVELETAAKRDGQPVSTWARETLLKVASK